MEGGVMNKSFVFSGVALLLTIPAIILAASLLKMQHTSSDIASTALGSQQIFFEQEGIIYDLDNMLEKNARIAVQQATLYTVELVINSTKRDNLPSEYEDYINKSEGIFKENKSLEFIELIAREGCDLDQDGEKEILGIEDYLTDILKHLSSLDINATITVENSTSTKRCTNQSCDLGGFLSLELADSFGFNLTLEGKWTFALEKNGIKFEKSFGNKNAYWKKIYVSFIGVPDPLLWWASYKFYRKGLYIDRPFTYVILKCPFEKERHNLTQNTTYLNATVSVLPLCLFKHYYHESESGASFLDRLEGRWWNTKDFGVETFLIGDILNLNNYTRNISCVDYMYLDEAFHRYLGATEEFDYDNRTAKFWNESRLNFDIRKPPNGDEENAFDYLTDAHIQFYLDNSTAYRYNLSYYQEQL